MPVKLPGRYEPGSDRTARIACSRSPTSRSTTSTPSTSSSPARRRSRSRTTAAPHGLRGERRDDPRDRRLGRAAAEGRHRHLARRVLTPPTSAGLLLFRERDGVLEVLLGHMGGPFWARKDDGAWSIPKGELGDGEDPLAGARREFAEELGHAPPDGPVLELGEIRQRAGKRVIAFAIEGDFDPARSSPGRSSCSGRRGRGASSVPGGRPRGVVRPAGRAGEGRAGASPAAGPAGAGALGACARKAS